MTETTAENCASSSEPALTVSFGSSNNVSTARLRRTKSVTRAEEITKQEEKLRKSQPDKPCHKPRDSLFSWSSEFSDFTGFINWGFLLLLVGGLRLMLENFIKYGVRVDPLEWLIALNGGTSGIQDGYPSLWMILSLNVQILVALGLEKLLSKDQIPWRAACLLHIANLASVLLMPIVAVNTWGSNCGIVGATCVCMACTITFLKLWSFVHVNSWCRKERNAPWQKHTRRQSFSTHFAKPGAKNSVHSNGLVRYPDNLNLRDMYYFVAIPTLCYELNFPQTARIRKRFLAKRVVETLIGLHVVLALFQQWIIPSVKNSVVTIAKMEVIPALERLLKLAIPNHLVWLIWFYLFFHSYLNLLGELLRFADREFYSDWWNARNVDVFWRSWNMTAHRWALRHLYMPLMELGCNKFFASFAVFFVSAFFHEYLVSVPLRMFKLWAFTGMMGQIPLSYLTQKLERRFGARIGNVIVWLSLILGQPLCIMAYYHDYVITHFGPNLLGQLPTA